MISVGSIETPSDAEKLIDAGVDFVALGRESLREPHWVQKVIAGQENAIRYTVAESDFEELGINSAFHDFLELLNADLHIVGSKQGKDEFDKQMGGVEGGA